MLDLRMYAWCSNKRLRRTFILMGDMEMGARDETQRSIVEVSVSFWNDALLFRRKRGGAKGVPRDH